MTEVRAYRRAAARWALCLLAWAVVALLASCASPTQMSGAMPHTAYVELGAATPARLVVRTGPPPLDAAKPWLAAHIYERRAAEAVVVLLHDLGSNARVWDLPGTPRLARLLWERGYAVVALDLFGAGDSWMRVPDSWMRVPGAAALSGVASEEPVALGIAMDRLWRALRVIADTYPGLTVFAIGHGLGGTLLYDAAASDELPRLAGIVTLGAPLSGRYPTRAWAALLQQAAATGDAPTLDWRRGRGHQLPDTYRGGDQIDLLLLSHRLDQLAWEAFYDVAVAPADAAWMQTLLTPAATQVRTHGLAARPALPVLAVIGIEDGFAPAWQCDPHLYGLMRSNISRLVLTRAARSETEFGHLDLILHPLAVDEIFDPLVDWLEEHDDGG